jgi:hypothetical protein
MSDKQLRRPRSPQVRVIVTPETIARSMPANSKACMLAESIKEAFPNAKTVSVDLQSCRFTDPDRGLRYTYLTPRTAQKALIDFDQGIQPQPFEITLKNAHVTRAPGVKLKEKLARQAESGKDPLARASTRTNANGGISRVGGRELAQMKVTRHFGIRAFKGFDATPPAAPGSS